MACKDSLSDEMTIACGRGTVAGRHYCPVLLGNMYKLGSGLCTWYAAWKAVIRARLGDGDTALQLLRRAAEETGCFGEVFEIHEADLRPWFSASAGM